jgi:hypothetical protein
MLSDSLPENDCDVEVVERRNVVCCMCNVTFFVSTFLVYHRIKVRISLIEPHFTAVPFATNLGAFAKYHFL